MWLFWVIAVCVLIFGIVVFFGAPYVPSHKRQLRRAFEELYPLGAGDVLVDVGSGDGIVLRTAEEYGARGIGYEINPILVLLSRILSKKNNNISTKLANFWYTQLPSETTIVYGFSVSRDGEKMTMKLQSEANRLNKQLYYIGYGSDLKGVTALKQVGAHRLYLFNPLQPTQAQV